MKRAMSVISAFLFVAVAMPAAVLADQSQPDGLRVGWASADITPDQPVVLRGQFHARVSEGVMDPVTATALALESVHQDGSKDYTVMVSVDLASLGDALRDQIREQIGEQLPDLDPDKVFFCATHTHSAPSFGARTVERDAAVAKQYGWDLPAAWADWGIELQAMPGAEYRDFAAGRIADAIVRAWNARQVGGVGFGLGHAVVGHNRLTVYTSGNSQMYGATDRPDFSHIEGYEDHAVHLLYTWDADQRLTGVVINVACPSQVSESIYEISADFWHDTREELRRRLGEHLFVLPQTGASGDQSPHLIGRRNQGENAEQRMERLAGRNRRQQIAVRIADAVTSVLPVIEKNIEWNPPLVHRVQQVELTRRLISQKDVTDAVNESQQWRKRYEQMRQAIEENPDIKNKRRWYTDITQAYRRTMRGVSVQERYELQQTEPKIPYEIHVLRIGDMAMATNPFELYLDFGVQIQQRSRAVQTFVVQLSGTGTYVPTERSVAGGAYGAVPASTAIGPEGGRELVEETLKLIDSLW
jgi:hypothetical protein